jgi:hypothetical protein
MSREDASYIESLETEIAKLRAEIEQKNAEIKRLKREKGISSAREGLSFNQHTGLWADQAGLLYCSTCLDQDKRNPMKSELPWGWRCSAVPKHYFSNPDSPRPQVTWGPRRDRI